MWGGAAANTMRLPNGLNVTSTTAPTRPRPRVSEALAPTLDPATNAEWAERMAGWYREAAANEARNQAERAAETEGLRNDPRDARMMTALRPGGSRVDMRVARWDGR